MPHLTSTLNARRADIIQRASVASMSNDPATGRSLKQGWLTKQSVSAWQPFKNWRRRHVVLSADKISWHDSEGSLILVEFAFRDAEEK